MNCEPEPPATFRVELPLVRDLPASGLEPGPWVDELPPVWAHHPDAQDDFIDVPNGRPIYALIVSGYESNRFLDELMVYRFARHLMSEGAYVHWAWWNNLLAPYMERPLHHDQSYPGDLNANGLDFATAAAAGRKAVPADDYQFVADAERLLTAIRENNPSAMIVLVGHSMGGSAVVHLASRSDVVLDIVAPIDAVNNRNYPWGGPEASFLNPDFNWTRWRVTREGFLGYRSLVFDQLACVPSGPWLKDVSEAENSLLCAALYSFHDAPTLGFGPEVINLHYRFQQEASFPFDYDEAYEFGHSPPPNGSTSQVAVPMTPRSCGLFSRCPDPGGWPAGGDVDSACCESDDGVGWNNDGHGEITGHRGPVSLDVLGLALEFPVPLGTRVGTSPLCGSNCPGSWPARSSVNGVWTDDVGPLRRQLLEGLERLPLSSGWAHRPTNPDLCLVSQGLIDLYERMNRPPVAVAGDDQTVECTGPDGALVTLDGSASSDPDSARPGHLDELTYLWTLPSGFASGDVLDVTLPLGTHCITLEVRDPSGHIDRDVVSVTVEDTTPPVLDVAVTPTSLWPPNHAMVAIEARVDAVDLCGPVAELELVSITSNEPDNGTGDGDTSGDIAGAEPGTLDTSFDLRAERSGTGNGRVYTILYQATDESGNRAETSVEVTVPKSRR